MKRNKENNKDSGFITVIILIAVLILGGLIVVGLLVGEEASENDTDYYSIQTWPQEAVDDYFVNCLNGSPDNLSLDSVKKFCGCNVDEFQSAYETPEQFSEATKDSASTYEQNYKTVTTKCADYAGLSIN